jgi:soluble cytochrome b562
MNDGKNVETNETPAEGQEPQQTAQETEGNQTPPETPAPDELDPKVVDVSDGKPWMEKAKEYERKYNGVLEKIVRQAEAPQQVDENEEIPATRSGVKQVLTEIQIEERQANQVFDEAMQDIIAEKPEFAPYREELKNMVGTLQDVKARKNPETIKLIAQGLWGRKNWKTPPSIPKPVKKLISTKESDVLPPSGKGTSTNDVELTDDEQDYSIHHGFDRKGFSNEEIKDMFQKSKIKKK